MNLARRCGIAGLVLWSVIPIYNMLLIALSDDGDEFTGAIWPEDWNFGSFGLVWTQGHRYLDHFWHQFGNSLIVGTATMTGTLVIGSMASFATGRMGRRLVLAGHLSLLTYAIPASFLAIPFTRVMQVYGLTDSLLAVIASQVMLAAPFAILIFHQYGKLIPLELDDAARVEGATPLQIYARIYLPLLAPALVPVGMFALLLAWNDYLYQFLLLSSQRSMTVAAAIDQFFDSDEAPWNIMMALAIVYAVPPVAVFFALQRFMMTSLKPRL
jgi:multiple sugar transport system permease protein